MTKFKKKQLEPAKRICLALKQARLAQNVSLEELSTRTKINKDYLCALEECRFSDLDCASIYQKNFIKKYIEALGLESKPYIEQFKEEELQFVVQAAKHPGKNYHRRYFSNIPQLLRYGGVAAIILTVFFYLGSQIKHTIEPPTLVLLSPEEGHITHEQIILIKGYTEPEVGIYLNGATIVSDEKGNFSESVTLNPGINAVMIRAEKKHGKAIEETRHIIYKEIKALSSGSPIES